MSGGTALRRDHGGRQETAVACRERGWTTARAPGPEAGVARASPADAEVEVKRAALECSRSAVLVAGSSKFGKYRVASLSDFDAIITGPALTEAAAEGVRGSGTELHLAAPA
ncbi:DeoR/GlpR family DNA-binding transcription regulator [Streptomyces diastaticus]|uniref:hypothetical protein n=1 Tax=Streptomyces diastaticus TaxID=1956 RepID=UPI001E3E07FB